MAAGAAAVAVDAIGQQPHGIGEFHELHRVVLLGDEIDRIDAIGEVDELNSHLGLLLCEPMPDAVRTLLVDVQHQLFNLGGELSMPGYTLLKAEALLQLDEALIAAMHERGFEIAIETNGTLPVHPDIDWVCVSPKAGVSSREPCW